MQTIPISNFYLNPKAIHTNPYSPTLNEKKQEEAQTCAAVNRRCNRGIPPARDGMPPQPSGSGRIRSRQDLPLLLHGIPQSGCG
jgi:hypothetical protein